MNQFLMLTDIIEPLLIWYRKNKRILPWRENPTPYHVWVSEIMLQQTRVEAVKAYYERFMEALPEIKDLAAAEEEKLLKLWEGLGYYSRIRNMQKAAQYIMEEYRGQLPQDYKELLKLPGIGEYTAGAIASIAFQMPVAAVDGNVLRVFSRLTASYEEIGHAETKRFVKKQIEAIMPQKAAGDFNQAIMELGATVCVPKGEPKCGECPIAAFCEAKQKGVQMALPIKAQKKKRKIEKRIVFIIVCDGKIALKKREKKGLLAGLWEFPNIAADYTRKAVREALKNWGVDPYYIKKWPEAKHIFTHIEWHMTGCYVKAENIDSSFVWSNEIERKEIYSLPSAFRFYQKEIEERGV